MIYLIDKINTTYEKKEISDIQVAQNLRVAEYLREFWEANQWHPNADIDFYLNIMNSRKEKAKSFILSLGSNGQPETVWIGRIEEKEVPIKLAYHTITKPRLNVLTFIYGGFLGCQSRHNIEKILNALKHLLKSKSIDVIVFQHILKDSLLFEILHSHRPILLRDFFPETFMHWKMTIPSGMEAIYNKLPAKRRQEIRRQTRKLYKDFNDKIRIECYAKSREIDRLMIEVEEIASKSYQRGIGVGFQNDAETRNRLLFLAEKGWLRAFVLYVKDEPCAFNVGTVYHQQFIGNFASFDRDFDKYTPGTILLLHVIELLIKENVQSLDFGFGDAFYKSRFGDDSWEESVVYFFSPTFKGMILSILRNSTIILSRLMIKVLGNFAYKIKKYWRKKLIPGTS